MTFDAKSFQRFRTFKRKIKNQLPYLSDDEAEYLAMKRMSIAKRKAII